MKILTTMAIAVLLFSAPVAFAGDSDHSGGVHTGSNGTTGNGDSKDSTGALDSPTAGGNHGSTPPGSYSGGNGAGTTSTGADY